MKDLTKEVLEKANLEPAKLAGTCRSGSDKVRGVLFHAVEIGAWYGATALCGKTPGRTSNGWYPDERKQQPVSCSKCVKKLTKLWNSKH